MNRRNKMIARLTLLGILACLTCLAGCLTGCPMGSMSRRYAAGTPSPRQELKPQLEARLRARLPDEARVVQKIALVTGHKQYDLIGYLLFKQPAQFRAVAMGEMGGRVFDFFMRGNDCTLLKAPRAMPPRPLTEGVMRDIRHVFGRPCFTGARLVERLDNQVGLVIPAGEEGLTEYVFRLSDLALVRSIESRKGRIIREAAYENPKPFKGWTQPFPSHIRIDNRRWRYTLEVDVLELGPFAISEAILKSQ